MERYISKQDSVPTDRSLNLSKIETFEQDATQDLTDFALYDSFSFSKHSAAKRFAEKKELNLRSPKKNYLFKNPTHFEYEKLLAIAEIRYIQMFQQLRRALLRNKKIMCMNLIYLIMKFKPLVVGAKKMIIRTYLRRWKCNMVPKRSNRRKMNSWGEKISSFLIQWRRVHQRNLLSAFLVFRERGIQHASIQKSKNTSRSESYGLQMTPSSQKLNLSSQRLNLSSQSTNSLKFTPSAKKPKLLDESTKKEFKKAIKGKFKEEEQIISRPGGLMRYFR